MNICIFASGTGSNFEAILKSIKKKYLCSEILLLITNNSDCGAVKIAIKNKINYLHISKKIYPSLSHEEYSDLFLTALNKYKINFIVLSGYMKMLPEEIVLKYKNKIINIHPALLPSFGGKGMFGLAVHRAVISSGVKVSGITIHFVSENYDEGKIIFQKCCEVKYDEDEYSLQKKVLKLEHKYYSEVIKKFEDGKVKLVNEKVLVE